MAIRKIATLIENVFVAAPDSGSMPGLMIGSLPSEPDSVPDSGSVPSLHLK